MMRNPFKRDAIAATECALALPIIFVFTLFTIEISSVLFLREAVTLAAYEGSRVGIQRGGTNGLARFRIEEFFDERGITYNSNSVSFSSPSFDDADELEHVQTTVSVPAAGNLPFGWFFPGTEVSADVTMRKEFKNPSSDDD